MDEEIVQADNTEEIAEPQIETQVEETVIEPKSEVQAKEDITQTQSFSKRLKEETSKYQQKQDAFAKRYGYESFEAMEQAESDREFKEKHGIDPNEVKPLFEQWKQNDPDFQELNNIRKEKNVNAALTDLNTELKENGIDIQLKDLSESELKKLPNIDKISSYVQKGNSLADAYFLANKKEIISKQTQSIQQETMKKIAANGQSSPGSLSSTGDIPATFTMQQINAMTQDQINKNYDAVMASIKRLKG